MNTPIQRAVVFGAGSGGKRFIENNSHAFKYVAYGDNDAKKQGTFLLGIPILSPEQTVELDYDVVVIASMWVEEIRQQLLDLGVPGHRLIVPPKNQLKNGLPFTDERTRVFAGKVLVNLCGAVDAEGIDIYLDFGTLLGIIREDDILEWDDDIDLSVHENSLDALLNGIPNVARSLPRPHLSTWTGHLSHDQEGNRYGISIDFHPVGKSGLNPFGIFIRSRRRSQNYSIPMGAVGNLEIPFEHFDGFEVVDYRGRLLKIPRSHRRYLELVYGEWQTPRRQLTFLDYAPADLASFGRADASSMQLTAIF